jgi:hypothetical protein
MTRPGRSSITEPPVNGSTGWLFHCAPFRRLESSETGVPWRGESGSFRKVPSAGRPRMRGFPKLPTSHRRQNQPDLCRSGQAAGLTPARRIQNVYPFGLYRRSSSCGGDPDSSGFGLRLTEFLASRTAFCSVEWKLCGEPINASGKRAPPTVVTITVP